MRLRFSLFSAACIWLTSLLPLIGDPAEAAIRTVYSFATPDGVSPTAEMIIGDDGQLYGTTAEGGIAGKGSIYRLSPSGQLTVLHSFQGSDGASPRSGLTRGVDGNFYGVTFLGGSNDYGVVFRITPSGQFTVLHSLIDGPAGVAPLGALTLGPDGNFFGTTSSGGSGAGGGLFKVSPSGAFQALHTLTLTDGLSPKAGLLLASDGNFYGVTSAGGGNNPLMSTAGGTVFKVTPAGQFSVIYVFQDPAAGFGASAALIEGSDGFLYGTARSGGSQNGGTVFKLTKAGDFTVLHSFDSANGALPSAALVERENGIFWGTTAGGGEPADAPNASPNGTVFSITSAGQHVVVHRFTGADGGSPVAALARSANGDLYGSTAGAFGQFGTVFRIGSDDTLTTILKFGHPNGSAPLGPLVQSPAGELMGVTRAGGANNTGVIFKLSLQGQFTVLKSFTAANGGLPLDGLTKGPDGAYYGTTSTGGENGSGTIFKIGDSGSLSVLHTFSGVDGASPNAPLVMGKDGALYGSTSLGGAGHGTLFRLSSNGVFSTLHVFNESDGATPYGQMAFGADGMLYGATATGGLGYGTLFKLTSSGVHTKIHSFPGDVSGFFPDGAYPLGGVTAAPDGNVYGTTSQNTIYRLTPNGVVTTIRRLNSNEGIDVRSPLLLGSDGNLYGTARLGGRITPGSLESFGTIFRIDLNGALEIVHQFSDTDGKEPETGLLQAANGMLYGVTPRGGSSGAGTVYEVPGPPLIPTGLVASPGDSRVSLTWQSAGGAQTYNVFARRATQSDYGAPVLTGVSSTSAIVRDLTNGDPYHFKIVAVNSVGQSLKSAEVSATPASADSGGGGGALDLTLIGLLAIAALRRRWSSSSFNGQPNRLGG